jgi:MFS family permease
MKLTAPMKFILLIGIVSLFADMTYEAARSVTGPYLEILGASATVVGFAAGFGELVGYGFRLVSGFISDRTGRYWLITFIGYAINLLAVPALALAGRWEIAVGLIVAERFGKAIRNPARNAMLSHATSQVGRGWGFGIHEALDQTGAVIGPIIVALVLGWKHNYPWAFAVLLIPAALALATLVIARVTYPNPQRMETSAHIERHPQMRRAFWLYILAIGLVAAGFADYPLIAYHMKNKAIFSDELIPLIYAGAMGVDAIAALVFGKLYDKVGLPILMAVIGVCAFFAPFAFSAGKAGIVVGVVLWGIGLGVQESVVPAVVSYIVPPERRATGYGIFNAGFGVAWFLGSALMGILYDRSILALVIFSTLIQMASLPVLYLVHKRIKTRV